MSGTFEYCPDSLVPELIPPDPVQGVSMNGWAFTSRPTVPYQRRFKVTLHGLRWYLNSDGSFDTWTNVTGNARSLELFYQANGVWDNFYWTHPHLGTLRCRFSSPLQLPPGVPGSNGLLEAVEVNLIEHSPGFSEW